MVFYFSGTGNSALVARQIAESLGDEMVSINQCLKEKETKIFRAEEPLIFVAPTYAWQMPKVVHRWIQESGFQDRQKAYFVLTCAGSIGNAAAYAKKLCLEKNLLFCGLAPVIMPNNYVALSDTPDKKECDEILEKAREQTDELIALIQQDRPFPESHASFKEKMSSGPVNTLYYSLFVHDQGFAATDACVSCGKCQKRCPLDNISMENGRPLWKGNCTHCMACIGGCPAEAIEYKKSSKNRRRYYIMED